MSLSSRFREVYSFTPDSVSSSPVVSGLSDESHGTLTQPIYSPRYSSGSNIVPNAYHYSDITDFVLLVISLVLLIIVLGVYFMKKYYYPPVEMSQVDITPVEITRTEINATRQQAVDRRPRQMSEGLDRKITESFPVVAYSAAQIANNPAECAVCLSEFQEGEKARWLPKCGHVFHLECIDRWLFSQSTCPLCRVSLIPESHAITLESTNSPHASTGLETSNSAVHANGGDVAALSEETTGLINNGAERDIAEGEALFAPSRSSQPLQHTAQEITIQER
ncbi:hypothetical protein O6H91_18G072100 [Diphasiastrum complanatum]|uniref:Uncharacterized protein n=1 Tax=Diphasiastrum complanatum TaxID=34168 RepID=A0ACC2B2I3_DIPCM|nr:hypothetical protein O6H91_18G072100 [Diphasiastrum complanatum]